MELEEVLEQCLGQNFVHMIISNPKKGDFAGKVDVRCYEDKGTLMFQCGQLALYVTMYSPSPDTRIIRYFILTMQKKRRKTIFFPNSCPFTVRCSSLQRKNSIQY